MKKATVIGILGGMGPFATLAFYRMLLEETPAKKDWEHFHVVIDVNTHIPSRSRHQLFREASPVPSMIESCQKLAAYPVDLIAIPCNSACAYVDQIRKHVATPILDIIEITAKSVLKLHPGAYSVAVVGGIVTYEKKTYERHLNELSLQYVPHTPALQRDTEHLIELIKSNALTLSERKKSLAELLQNIASSTSADTVILGCTEFGEMGDIAVEANIVDSSKSLVRHIIDLDRNRG